VLHQDRQSGISPDNADQPTSLGIAGAKSGNRPVAMMEACKTPPYRIDSRQQQTALFSYQCPVDSFMV
jgi:hypothetical protein